MTPVLIFWGAHFPIKLLNLPVYQLIMVFVYAKFIAPVVSEFLGEIVGSSLFYPKKANLDHPTMSHIISLRNKRLYEEAKDELWMLTDKFPHELEPYKMLLYLSSFELPGRSFFDMIYRKGMFNIDEGENREKLKNYRNEFVIQFKNEQTNNHTSLQTDENTSVEIFANIKHTKPKSVVDKENLSGTVHKPVNISKESHLEQKKRHQRRELKLRDKKRAKTNKKHILHTDENSILKDQDGSSQPKTYKFVRPSRRSRDS